MAIKDKDKSLLELAIELLQKKRKPCKINTIIEEVMEIKGYKGAKAKEHTPQFLLDFMQSGYFVYCGDDCWDLKERQSTSVIDKDGGDYEAIYNDDEDVKKNELKDETIYDSDYESTTDDDSDEDEDDEEDDDIARELNNQEEDDLSNEFETVSYDESDEDEDVDK